MNKTILLSAAFLMAVSATSFAQQKAEIDNEAYQFTTVKELPVTSVKNQASTGTCWCFSTISFLESEAIRKGYKGDLDLSEMFVVSKSYQDRAVKYVRTDGHINFAQGSSFGDVIATVKEYGIVPNSVMDGLNYGETRHMHSELAAGLTGYLQAIVKNPNRKLSTAWQNGFKGIVDAYLGECPESFEYNGKNYTPAQYRDEIGLDMDEYVDLTSFTHHPFYTKFAIEVADNWRWEESYNLPLEELKAVMYNAIENGYTIAWGADVSEAGFTRKGLGVMPEAPAANGAGSDQARWVGADAKDKAEAAKSPLPEVKVDQELRQTAFDNKQTTDDHGMHIYGIAKDQNGTNYFLVKNSWGETGSYKGVWYVSDTFVRYKTLNICVHKDAIPKDIKKKLGIK